MRVVYGFLSVCGARRAPHPSEEKKRKVTYTFATFRSSIIATFNSRHFYEVNYR